MITDLIVEYEKFLFDCNSVQNEEILKVFINGEIILKLIFISIPGICNILKFI